MNSKTTIVGAIDIGTSKVVVLVALVTPGQSMTLIGKGQTTAAGMKRGEIMNMQQISDCTHAAIGAAEKQAEAEIERVCLSISGAHVRGFRHSGMTAINSSRNIVSEVDLYRAIENARNKVLEPGTVYLHHIRNGNLLDGRPVEDPVGRSGYHLEVHYWHVVGEEQKIRDHMHIINGFGLEVNDLLAASLASGSLLATAEEKRQGVLVVDIGKGTTDYVLYKAGRVVQTGVIPVGGEHVTNDLSLGLRTKPKYAEALKLRAAQAIIGRNDRSERVPLIGDYSIGDCLVSCLTINKIVHLRLEELFIILKNRLGSLLSRQNLPAGVILTGGVSKTPRLAELAELILDVPVALGHAPEWVAHEELRDPEYSTVLGLLYNATHRTDDEAEAKPPRRPILRRLSKLFNT